MGILCFFRDSYRFLLFLRHRKNVDSHEIFIIYLQILCVQCQMILSLRQSSTN